VSEAGQFGEHRCQFVAPRRRDRTTTTDWQCVLTGRPLRDSLSSSSVHSGDEVSLPVGVTVSWMGNGLPLRARCARSSSRLGIEPDVAIPQWNVVAGGEPRSVQTYRGVWVCIPPVRCSGLLSRSVDEPHWCSGTNLAPTATGRGKHRIGRATPPLPSLCGSRRSDWVDRLLQ
jgi:hypothetical protein